jgi:WD40 repeat protein
MSISLSHYRARRLAALAVALFLLLALFIVVFLLWRKGRAADRLLAVNEPVPETREPGSRGTNRVAIAGRDAASDEPADGVISLAFSGDGRLLASGHQDRFVRVWDLGTRRLRAALQGHADAVSSLAFAPDGKTLASASREGFVCLWDLTAEPPREQAALSVAGSAVAFSPDGRTLGSCLWFSGRLWDLTGNSPRPMAVLHGNGRLVQAVTFAPDGKTLACATNDGVQRL